MQIPQGGVIIRIKSLWRLKIQANSSKPLSTMSCASILNQFPLFNCSVDAILTRFTPTHPYWVLFCLPVARWISFLPFTACAKFGSMSGLKIHMHVSEMNCFALTSSSSSLFRRFDVQKSLVNVDFFLRRVSLQELLWLFVWPQLNLIPLNMMSVYYFSQCLVCFHTLLQLLSGK